MEFSTVVHLVARITVILTMISKNSGRRTPCTDMGCVTAANSQLSDSHVGNSQLSEFPTLLEDYSGLNNTINSIQFVKQLYKKCMDKESINILGTKPIHKFLNDIGGWPTVNQTWDENFMDLTTLTGLIAQYYAMDILVHLSVEIDMHDKTKYILQAETISTMGPREYYINDSMHSGQIEMHRNLFLRTVSFIASDLNVTPSIDVAMEDWSKMLSFEKKLGEITLPTEDRRSSLLNHSYTTLAEFSSLYNV
uniref:Peptidase M13 N-terminal domain-containing protein n=1 Tax=Romanomermis culicivorax TaxID=13658 RepID=A0A915KY29_ROMCU